jgi:hypothetical protein
VIAETSKGFSWQKKLPTVYPQVQLRLYRHSFDRAIEMETKDEGVDRVSLEMSYGVVPHLRKLGRSGDFENGRISSVKFI